MHPDRIFKTVIMVLSKQMKMRSVRGHLMQLRFFSSENLVERNKEVMRIETPKTKWPEMLI